MHLLVAVGEGGCLWELLHRRGTLRSRPLLLHLGRLVVELRTQASVSLDLTLLHLGLNLVHTRTKLRAKPGLYQD